MSKYQLFEELSEQEYQLLKNDIAERGVQVPVELDEKSNILDGHHRIQACDELGIEEYPTIVRYDMDEREKRAHIRKLNSARRQLTKEQLNRQVIALRKEGMSQRAISDETGVSRATVIRTLNDEEVVQKDHLPDHVIGKDGKKYPASKPSTVHNKKPTEHTIESNNEAVQELKEEAPDLHNDVSSGKRSIGSAKKKLKLRKAHEEHTEQTKASIQTTPLVTKQDALTWLPSKPSCDLLLTDPPYSTEVENINMFAEWLSVGLDKVKDTGRAYVFVGAYPNELKAYLNIKTPPHISLEQILIWSYKNTLGQNPKKKYKQNYQACLYFVGTNAPELSCPLTTEQWAVSEINAPDGRQGNRYHTWQKPLEIAERYIRHSTKEGDTVYDPFVCTGTFVLAAARLGRVGHGCDISDDNLSIAIERGCEYA